MIGAGNVALDVARMLAKPVEEQLVTDIPANVEAGLRANRASDVHVFARRGPAQVKVTALELRELAHSPTVDVIVHPRGLRDRRGQPARHHRQQVHPPGRRHPAEVPRGPDHRRRAPHPHPPVPGFDHIGGVHSHQAGRVLDLDGTQVGGVYATGWIKRGPIGLIGHTKSDAAETVASLLDDLPGLPAP